MKRLIVVVCFLVMAVAMSKPAAADPLGYPWSTWGELSQTFDHNEDGLKIDGYVEQGVDWLKLGSTDVIWNTFVGMRLVQSDQHDYWNNKLGPWFGTKLKYNLQPFDNGWGEIDLGIRGEYYTYTKSGGPDNELRGVLFLQWSFGGDWKKK